MTDKTTTEKPTASKSTSTKPVPLAFTLDPSSGPEQTPITISGKDFGDTAGTIRLNEVSAPVLTWTDTEITTSVPYGASTGDLVVRTADGRSAAVAFTVEPPR